MRCLSHNFIPTSSVLFSHNLIPMSHTSSVPCLPHPHSHVSHILIPMSHTSSFPCLPHPQSHVSHILSSMSPTSSVPCLTHPHSHVFDCVSYTHSHFLQHRSDRDDLVFLLKREAAKKARKVRAEERAMRCLSAFLGE